MRTPNSRPRFLLHSSDTPISLFASAAEDRQRGWLVNVLWQPPNFIKGALSDLDKALRDEQLHQQSNDDRLLLQRDSNATDQGIGEVAGDMPSDDDSALEDSYNRCVALQSSCSSLSSLCVPVTGPSHAPRTASQLPGIACHAII